MRVIAGQAKGRRLLGPHSDKIRPALDKIKGAIFNILYNVEGLRVLDIFAGTGAIGIEALSRGAAHVTFIDNYQPAVDVIKKNLARCGFERDRAAVLKVSMRQALRSLSRKNLPFDLIFVDPPYLKDLVNTTLNLIVESELTHPETIIIVEHHPKEEIKPPKDLEISDVRKYGQTLISFLRPKRQK